MQRALVGGLILGLVACGGGGGEKAADSAAGGATPTPAATTPAAGGGGAVAGMVKFTGTAPANPPVDMSAEGACKGKYTTDPVVKVANGMLANVIIYVKSGLPAGQTFPTRADTIEIDQEGCLYHPRALAVQISQPFEIKNNDPVLHNIKAVPKANRGFNISQPKAGMMTTRTFTTEEITIPLECNVHGWMHANVAVFAHPFFGVSKDDGSFEIKGLPPGTYELEAWHATLGTKTVSVTVPATGSATAEFTFGAAGA